MGGTLGHRPCRGPRRYRDPRSPLVYHIPFGRIAGNEGMAHGGLQSVFVGISWARPSIFSALVVLEYGPDEPINRTPRASVSPLSIHTYYYSPELDSIRHHHVRRSSRTYLWLERGGRHCGTGGSLVTWYISGRVSRSNMRRRPR